MGFFKNAKDNFIENVEHRPIVLMFVGAAAIVAVALIISMMPIFIWLLGGDPESAKATLLPGITEMGRAHYVTSVLTNWQTYATILVWSFFWVPMFHKVDWH